MVTITLYARQQKRQSCTEQSFWTLWEKVRVGWFGRMTFKHVYDHMWNGLPVQVWCMIQGAWGWCTGMTSGMGWGGRREGGSGWGTHVNPWLIYVNVWQKLLQYCKVISLQLIKINEKNPTFFTLFLTFIKWLFSSSLLSAIRVVSSAYLNLLIFLPAVLIPVCALSGLAFGMMYSAYKLNKQGDNIQPWHTPFLIWNQSVVPCLVLTVASWPAYRFLRRQVRWSGIPISFRIFHSLLLWFTQSKALVQSVK